VIRFIARRIVIGVLVLLTVSITVFFVTRIIGDPVDQMLSFEASPEARAELRHSFGYDRPLATQFGDFMTDVATLDFGDSLWQRRPAMELITERLPATFQLVLTSMALALVIFVPLGVIAALRPGSVLDRSLVFVALTGISMPSFWLGAVLILIFSVNLGWLPTSGRGTWEHLVLPALSLALPCGARIAMITRTSVIDQLSEPYMATARAKGFDQPYIVSRHLLRNAMVPIVSVSAFELAQLLASGAVVVETVFAWPGLGRLAVQSITNRDLVLLQAVVVFVAGMVIVSNIIADVLYKAVDPRIKLK
jgi:peptide/nickel transport system permease protein